MKLVVVSLLLAAVISVPVAVAAGTPFHFSSRARFEAAARLDFVSIARARLHRRYRVLSIGCAKAGNGRGICAVVASGPAGVSRWEYGITCASDTRGPCTSAIAPWRVNP